MQARSTRWTLILAAALVGAGVACHDALNLRGVQGEEPPPTQPATDAPPETSGPPIPLPGSGGGSVPDPVPPQRLTRVARPNPIPAENALPGHPRWREGGNADRRQLEVYTSLDSAVAGESVAVKVSTDVASQVRGEVYRLGYYGGAGARRVWEAGPFTAGRQEECPVDPTTARVECRWRDTFTFTVGSDWVSGIYVVKVVREDGFKRFHPLVVRDDRAADILFQPGFNTYQAYNTWGGHSLYSSSLLPEGRSYEVSYDRPYVEGEGAGQMLWWEYPFVRTLEEHGYDVTYASNLDFERVGNLLEGVGAFVHGGHDEYWTSSARTQLDAALESGQLSLAHFGANGAYWRVRLTPSSSGQPLRTVVCYKNVPHKDPVPGSTVRFRDEPAAHPENALFGTMYESWEFIDYPLVVREPGHWLFEGTGLKAGELLHGLVGNEHDRIIDNGHTPSGLSVPLDSPLVSAEGVPGRAQTVERTLPNGRLVFSAGTIFWGLAHGDDPELHDPRVVRMSLNVLERALAHRRAPRQLPPVQGRPPVRAEPQGLWAQEVVAVAGEAGPGGWRDGPGAQALFSGPTGLAVLPGEGVVVADTGNNRIRLIGNDTARTVTTLAGNGELGWRDGPGLQAMFRRPTGVAVAPDGSLYVADSDNHLIRRLVRQGGSWQVETVAGRRQESGFRDGPGEEARFHRPTALALDVKGSLYVADQAGHRIRRVVLGTHRVETVVGSGAIGMEDAAVGVQATLNNPSALAVGADGTLYFIDANQRVRQVAPTGTRAVSLVTGQPGWSWAMGFADGTGEEARFRAQLGMVVLPGGELLLSDTGNYRLRKVVPGTSPATARVYTFAGSGRGGTRLGAGDEADIVTPTGLARDEDGVLFVSDSGNNVIRAVVR